MKKKTEDKNDDVKDVEKSSTTESSDIASVDATKPKSAAK